MMGAWAGVAFAHDDQKMAVVSKLHRTDGGVDCKVHETEAVGERQNSA